MEITFVFGAVRFLALLGRFAGFFLAVPVFTFQSVPMRYRALLAATCSVLVLPLLPPDWGRNVAQGVGTLPYLTLVLLSELLFGLTVALIAHIVREVFVMAGQLMGRSMGFAMAVAFDPSTMSRSSMVSVLLGQVFVMLLLLRGVHLDFVRLALESVYRFEPGGFVPTEGTMDTVVSLVGWMYVMAARLALPLICVVMFVNLAMALMTKFGKEFQVLMLAFPIRIGLGLLVFSATVPVMVFASRGMMETMLGHLQGLLAG